MPEGHTIHRLARDHHRWFAGQTVAVSSPQGRFATEAARLDGRVFERAEAWGKHLFHHVEGGLLVHVHLGLIGRFRMRRTPLPEPRGAIRYRLVGDERGVDLIGPMTCRLLRASDQRTITATLGPDPLRDDADPDEAWQRLHARRAALGTVLLDQSVIAGIGNVYRAELLFRHGLHPRLPASQLTRRAFDDLWADLVGLLQLGVQTNRIITVDPQALGVPPRALKRGQRQNVYKRRQCARCGGPVTAPVVGQRKCYTCEVCQPPPAG